MRTNVVRPADPRYTAIAAFDYKRTRLLCPPTLYLSVIQ
jgi:hypothetical protein